MYWSKISVTQMLTCALFVVANLVSHWSHTNTGHSRKPPKV